MTDRALDIAIGDSRLQKRWHNKQLLWSDLVKRLSKPTRTQETMAEYKAMSKEQKAKIKDVGGYVAGYCKNGNRSDVLHRSCITLDADSVVSDIWADWQDLYGNAALIYSTHTHTADNPRYRLIIPADRDMSPDEYQACSRRIADTLGMDNFDESTHQPQRLMYWGSCSRDAEYIFDECKGELISVDTVLATYHDWRDISAWPTNSKLPNDIKKSAKKQSDPLEKSGLIGAFCRAYYPIQTAIEKFVPEYEPCEGGRYTYTEGSAAAGVVIYDDKFSYSNHATDPASCQLCNAWDLVRIHKFGVADEDAKEDTPVPNLPSYKKMAEMAAADGKVKIELVKALKEEAETDFTAEEESEDAQAWRTHLKVTSKGGLEQSIHNAVVVLTEDPALKGCIAYDEMRSSIITVKNLPWRKIQGKWSEWNDTDDAALRYYMESLGLAGKDRLYDAVNNVALQNRIHPVKDFIEEAAWDGVPRVEELFIKYLGAADTEYTRTISRKTLTAAVARIYNPGVKFDYMLTLRGKQGAGKSSLMRRLAGEWFSDSMTTMQGKESFEQLQGVWIMEIGELASMKKSDIETIKCYLSKTSDRFRPAYARRTQDFPRQCIFVATTNEALFLRDMTGNRRFWILDLPNAKEDEWQKLTDAEIPQIWAEAKHYYDNGEQLYLNSKMEAVAQKVQEQFMEEDSRLGIIEDYLDRLLPEEWATMDLPERRDWLAGSTQGTVRRTKVCTMEIYCEALCRNPDKVDTYELKCINQIMTRLNEWKYQGDRRARFPLYKQQRYYLYDEEAIYE